MFGGRKNGHTYTPLGTNDFDSDSSGDEGDDFIQQQIRSQRVRYCVCVYLNVDIYIHAFCHERERMRVIYIGVVEASHGCIFMVSNAYFTNKTYTFAFLPSNALKSLVTTTQRTIWCCNAQMKMTLFQNRCFF
uniref:Uncharacterized protein n=1 Tax=Ditylum brightwellii TaxID=49249 RepID=A0A7S4QEK3_9STRA